MITWWRKKHQMHDLKSSQDFMDLSKATISELKVHIKKIKEMEKVIQNSEKIEVFKSERMIYLLNDKDANRNFVGDLHESLWKHLKNINQINKHLGVDLKKQKITEQKKEYLKQCRLAIKNLGTKFWWRIFMGK